MRVFVKDLQEFVLMIDVYEQIVAITTQMGAGAGKEKVAGHLTLFRCQVEIEERLQLRSPHGSQCTLNARIARNCEETFNLLHACPPLLRSLDQRLWRRGRL